MASLAWVAEGVRLYAPIAQSFLEMNKRCEEETGDPINPILGYVNLDDIPRFMATIDHGWGIAFNARPSDEILPSKWLHRNCDEFYFIEPYPHHYRFAERSICNVNAEI